MSNAAIDRPSQFEFPPDVQEVLRLLELIVKKDRDYSKSRFGNVPWLESIGVVTSPDSRFYVVRTVQDGPHGGVIFVVEYDKRPSIGLIDITEFLPSGTDRVYNSECTITHRIPRQSVIQASQDQASEQIIRLPIEASIALAVVGVQMRRQWPTQSFYGRADTGTGTGTCARYQAIETNQGAVVSVTAVVPKSPDTLTYAVLLEPDAQQSTPNIRLLYRFASASQGLPATSWFLTKIGVLRLNENPEDEAPILSALPPD